MHWLALALVREREYLLCCMRITYVLYDCIGAFIVVADVEAAAVSTANVFGTAVAAAVSLHIGFEWMTLLPALARSLHTSYTQANYTSNIEQTYTMQTHTHGGKEDEKAHITTTIESVFSEYTNICILQF